MKALALLSLCMLVIIGGQAHAVDTLEIFNGKNLSNWEVKKFSGQTNYSINNAKLTAQCDATASSQYLKQKINLNETVL